ncbi:MAG: hypothetical protein C0599_05695 [Salinivirgaceae bacterium]|nr:MAG: hypothetical protein C0599_05695 [Salinivirgaceae bacterium]
MKTLIIILSFLTVPFISIAQIDTTFWFVAPEITESHVDRPINLVVSSQEETLTMVTVSMPMEPTFTPINIVLSGYETYLLDLTSYIDLIEPVTPGLSNKGIRIEADAPITAYYEVAALNNRDIYALKGANALGYEFFCPIQNIYNNHSAGYPIPARNRIDIVATEDGTIVSFEITAAANGMPAGSIITTPEMQAGETYSIVADDEAAASHLGGTKITSNNKKIAVTLSDDSVDFPTVTGWDLIGDQIVPVQNPTNGDNTIGYDYVVVKTRLLADESYFILATEDNTNIEIDGSYSGTLNTGQTLPVIISGDTDFISCDKRVYLFHVGGFDREMGGALLPSIDGCKGSSRVSIPRIIDEIFNINLLVKGDAYDSFYMKYEDSTTYHIPPDSFAMVPNMPEGENWYYLKRTANTFEDGQSPGVPVGQTTTIYNTKSIFQMGVYDGSPTRGCKYGYFSDFKPQSFATAVFATDTIYTARPDTLILDAGSVFTTYEWQDGSTNQTFEVTSDTSQMYYVTVQHIASCEAITDSVYVNTEDIQPTAILSPTLACEPLFAETTVQIQNNSGNTIPAGEQIEFGVQINEEIPVLENYTLTTDIEPNSSATIVLANEFDFSQAGTYQIKLWCNKTIDNDRTNDTITSVLEVYPNPDFQVNYATIHTANSDTVTLIVSPSTFESYLWNVGVDNDTLSLAGYDESSYTVTVTDEHGCSNDFTVDIVNKNIGIQKLVAPIDACEHTSEELVTIRLKNTGDMLIEAGSLIDLSIAGSFNINEQLTLSEDLSPQDTIDYTFTNPIDLNTVSAYTLDISISADFDVSTDDDELSANIETFGPAIIDLGEEVTTTEIPYSIDAGDGYSSYLWHNGSTEQTFTIDETNISPTGIYSVAITNTNGCEGSDSKTVHVDIIDWAVDEVLSPSNDCYEGFDGQLTVQISNQSPVPVQQGRTFNIGYSINDETTVEEQFILTDSLYPQETLTHVFTELTGYEPFTNNIAINLNNVSDIDTTNDMLNYTLNLYNPELSFTADTIIPESFPFDLVAPYGFNVYEWNNGQTGQTLVVNTSDIYILTVYDSYGCSDTDSIFIAEPVGIYQNGLQKCKMKIWPNPAQKEISIEINRKTKGDGTIEIISNNGKLVWKKESKSTDAILTIPVSDLSEGMYLIRFYDNDEYIIENIVIRK